MRAFKRMVTNVLISQASELEGGRHVAQAPPVFFWWGLGDSIAGAPSLFRLFK